MQLSREHALEILRLPPSASQAEIEKQFRVRINETHPDRGGDVDEFTQVLAARDHLMDEFSREVVLRRESALAIKEGGSELIALERERDLQRQRREKSERVTQGLVRTEVSRLTHFRRTAHFLTWLGGGAVTATLALSATTFRGAENLWIGQVAIVCIVVSALCAAAGFVISGQISRMEQALEDAAEAMSDRSTFLDLFYEITEHLGEDAQASWTMRELRDAIQSWSLQIATYQFWMRRRRHYVKGPKRIFYVPQELRRRVLSVFGQLESNPSLADLGWVIGPTSFSRLLIAKGEETGLLFPEEMIEEDRLQIRYRLSLELASQP